MSDFTTILNKTVIASTKSGVTVTEQFKNISVDRILVRLKKAEIGEKDGSHFIRTTLNQSDGAYCLPRSDNNAESMASLLSIDCDKHVDSYGEEQDGAPSPIQVGESLKAADIGHIIFGSYSYYCGLTRYRIILVTQTPYTKEQLTATAEAIVALININISGIALAYASENGVWSQPWYYPRKPADSLVDQLYIEYLEGNAVEVIKPQSTADTTHTFQREESLKPGEISPIQAFNQQNSLADLLSFYGYKRVLLTKEGERWLSPDSSTLKAGIFVKNNKFFCHHGSDPFHDGYWHDSFDLMRVKEGLTLNEAIIKAARNTKAPDGSTVDEYNKKFARKTTAQPEKKPLPHPRPDVLPLQDEMLPKAIRDYVLDIADRQQSLPDFVAVAAIVGLSSLLGRKASICPKQFDSWEVTPNLWGALIGRPSTMKSPSMKEALKPLWEFDVKAAQQFKTEIQNYEAEFELLKLEKNTSKYLAKEALKSNNREEARKILNSANCITQPVRQRLIVNDATVEKLGELLNENPNGLLLVRDELFGLLAKLHKEEFQAERTFYLECFDGNGHYIYDRIGRGTIDIKNCTLSIIGGIQPSKIATLVRDAIRGTSDDGLIQRFQLAIWPDDVGSWDWIDRAPNKTARENYNGAFKKLYQLDFKTDNGEPFRFRFNDEAQELFIDWMKEIQATARSIDTHPALESHMLKMPQTIASLALLFEIVDGGRKTVGTEATARALDWADYLLSHARRLYSIATNHSLDGAKLILERKDKLPNSFASRDVQRKGWSGLDSIVKVNEALTWLADYGHIMVEAIGALDTSGRPKIIYHWISE